jgi:hypothetical protein
MKKPNRKDFPTNRNGRSRYLTALRKYEEYTKRQQQKVKGKTSKLNVKKFPKGDPRTIEALKKRQGGPNKGKNIVKSSPDKPFDPLNKPLRIKKDGPGRTKNKILKPDSEAKQDLKDQKSKRFGGKLPQGSGIVQKTPKKKKVVQKKKSNNNLKDAIKKNEKGLKELKNKKVNTSKKAESEDKRKTTGNQKLKIKKDPLADYRRGPGTKLGKDTRITKSLKKAGFTEDRLARLRKKHAEFKAKRKKKKKS